MPLLATQSWGVLQDGHGNVRPGLEVVVKRLDGTTALSATTASDGTIPGSLPVGEYTATYVGITKEVHVVSGVPGSEVDIRYHGADTAAADNTAAINAAIAALPDGGGTLLVPGRFEFTGMLDFDDTRSITLRGVGGLSGGASTTSALVYTGGGSGRAVSARSTFGFALDGVSLFDASPAFTGTLLDFGHSATGGDSQMMSLDRGVLYSATQTALLLSLDKALLGNFRLVNFIGGDVAVRGLPAAGSYSNVHLFTSCQFARQKTVEVKNAGQSWTFQSTAFEQLYNGAVSAGAGAYASDAGIQAHALNFLGCWLGDATVVGTWIEFSGTGLVVQGTYISNGAKGIALPADEQSLGISITGTRFDTVPDAFDAGSGNLSIDYFANSFNTVTNEVLTGAVKPVGSRIHSPAAGDIRYSASLHLYNPADPPVIQMYERTDPGNAPADSVYVFAVDSGAGKTLLRAHFASGAAQTAATEP